MASIGRGRGWAKLVNHDPVLRRPGRVASPEKSELDRVIDKIYELGVNSTPRDRLTEVVNFLKNHPDYESTENLNALFNQALDDRCFGIKLIKLFRTEYPQIDKEGKSLVQKNILSAMQTSYERKEELQKENPLHLTNLTWMLGFLAQLESRCISRIGSCALLNCLNLLLDTATEDDVETVAIQLYLNGGKINKKIEIDLPTSLERSMDDSVELSSIVNKARRILVNRNVSTRSRALLQLIIDLGNQQFEPVTGELQTFYASVLEPSQMPENDSDFLTGREFNQQLYLYKLLTKGMEPMGNKNNSVTFQELPRNKSSKQQAPKLKKNEGTPVPRAIRGSGASESSKDHRNEKKSPRGHKEKLTDEQVWSAKQNTGSKVWGHDDRFDNDYE